MTAATTCRNPPRVLFGSQVIWHTAPSSCVCMCHYPSYLMLCYPLSKLSLLEKLNHYVTANNTLYITAATFKSLYTPSSRKRLESIPCSEYHVFVVVYFTTTNSNLVVLLDLDIYNILYIYVIFCATAPV